MIHWLVVAYLWPQYILNPARCVYQHGMYNAAVAILPVWRTCPDGVSSSGHPQLLEEHQSKLFLLLLMCRWLVIFYKKIIHTVLREVRWEMPVGLRPVFPQLSMQDPLAKVLPYRTGLGIVLELRLAHLAW